MSTQQSGLVSGNSQNAAGGNTPKSRSKFPESYSKFQTERFAEYAPFFVMEGVDSDSLPLNSNHEVQTYTLKSPILQSLTKKKDYFAVPMQAILPLNWEKFYTNPNIGQDVPTDCGLGVENFWSKVRTMFNNDLNILETSIDPSTNPPETNVQRLDKMFHFLCFYEMFYSTGSLMETLNISGHNWMKITRMGSANDNIEVPFDVFFDELIAAVQTALSLSHGFITMQLGGKTYYIMSQANEVNSGISLTLREALELMRDDLSFSITAITTSFNTSLGNNLYNVFVQYSFNPPVSDAPLNLGRLWAYQLTVAHFYSNDHVDFIYSADLFRQYIMQLVTYSSSNNSYSRVFTVNGLEYQYDALSSYYCGRLLTTAAGGILSTLTINVSTPNSQNDLIAYFVALLSFKRSLRFLDYFTGSRTYPLAIGNTTVNVNSNKVDVVELAQSSMMTKFLQAVNRSGRKFSAYMKELFGKTPAYDYHHPMYLAHTSDLVGAAETENTGAAQMSDKIAVTSRLRATSSRYAFSFTPDRDCIVIGITYYDLPRVYARATEAQNFFIDRFDMFNPFLQFIGDQSITEAEIGTTTPNVALPFSYTNRHMEYKQRYNQCCGGFCVPNTGLDNWIFPADVLRRNQVHSISPSFIRSFNSELDRFYQSLTGYSLGTYFHFIVRYDNRMDASRPMAYAPSINV